MKLFQTTIGRILAVVVLICLLPAMYISWQRNQVETRARTVEMVYDYDNVLSRAAVERTTVDDLFALYRKSGITSLALYDETATKLVSRGDARVMSVSAMHNAALDNPEIRDDCVYIQPSATDTDHVIFNELKNAVRDNFRPQDIRELTVNGTDTIEVRADYQAFIETPLGIFPSRVKAAASHGFYVVLRPKNNPEAGKAAIDDFLKAVDASPKVSAVIFTGKDVLGFSHNRYNPYLSEELNKRHIPVVLIEAQNQLGFEPQQGILDMAREDGYRNVRLYAMSKDELIKLSPEEASSRFYISDIERNIRMNLFPSYKDAQAGMTLSETNASYINDIKDRLIHHGFHIGKASIMDPYYPPPVLRAVVMLGAAALGTMALLLIIPSLTRFGFWIFGAGVILTQGLYWGTHSHSVMALQLLALVTEICTPVIVVSLFMDYCLAKKEEAYVHYGLVRIFAEAVVVLWLSGMAVLLCANYVSALLGDITFLLEVQYFRGVKLTFVLPVLLISLVYIQKFKVLGHQIRDDRDFVSFVKEFCNIPIKMGILILMGILALTGIIFVGRSGNNGAPVPGFEVALRRYLEAVMYARPREKEFLFGHPAVFMALVSYYRKWPELLHFLFILAFTIGQGSMIETFAHMRSPFILSLVRGLDGLAAGTGIMVLALLAVAVLLRITKFFGGRYGKE